MKGKSLIVIPQYFYPTYGGLQNFTSHLCQALAKKGVKLTILFPEPENDRKVINQTIPSKKNITLIQVKGTRSAFWKSLINYVGKIETSKILIIGLEYENLIEEQLSFISEAHKLKKEISLRIATCNDFTNVIKKRKNRIKKLEKCKRIITINKEILKEIKSNTKIKTKPIQNITVLKRGEKANIGIKRSLRLSKKDFCVLWTGRIDPVKNLEDILISWKNSGVDGHLLFAGIDCYGEGKYLKKLKKLMKTEKIKKVKFIGAFNQEELHSVYKECDLYVFSSINEGFSNSILQAASAKLPIIAFDIPGTREVLNYYDKNYYSLIKQGDTNSFTEAIKKEFFLWYDKERKKEPSLKKIKKELSPEKISEKYLKELFPK